MRCRYSSKINMIRAWCPGAAGLDCFGHSLRRARTSRHSKGIVRSVSRRSRWGRSPFYIPEVWRSPDHPSVGAGGLVLRPREALRPHEIQEERAEDAATHVASVRLRSGKVAHLSRRTRSGCCPTATPMARSRRGAVGRGPPVVTSGSPTHSIVTRTSHLSARQRTGEAARYGDISDHRPVTCPSGSLCRPPCRRNEWSCPYSSWGPAVSGGRPLKEVSTT